MGDCKDDCKLIQELYNNINDSLVEQNTKLENQIKKVGEVYSTDYQKSNYQTTNVMYYKFLNNILFWVYYMLVFIILIILIQSNISRAMKVLVAGAFIVYPLIINNIEILLYGVLKYIYAMLSGTVYSPPDFASQ